MAMLHCGRDGEFFSAPGIREWKWREGRGRRDLRSFGSLRALLPAARNTDPRSSLASRRSRARGRGSQRGDARGGCWARSRRGSTICRLVGRRGLGRLGRRAEA